MSTSSQASRSSASSPAPNSSPSTLNERAVSTSTGTARSGARSTEFGNDRNIEAQQNVEDSLRRRRHRPRNSGGFLLSSNIRSPPKTGHAKDYGTNIEEIGHGKSKENGQSSHKPRGYHDNSPRKSAIARSPLANEVVQVASDQDEPETVGSTRAGEVSDGSGQNRSSVESGFTPPFDSDPAQIVNLALNLSESRRRHFSTGRVTSLDPTAGSRRIVSTPQIGGLPGTPGIGSLKHHISQQRRVSRNISPRADRTPSTGRRISHAHPTPTNGLGLQSQLLPDLKLGALVDPTFSPSESTLNRAEKARVALELAYEHRRLLQYLPALPACPECRPSAFKGTALNRSDVTQPLGRVYNPLQYIRNRKVRVRERQTLDSEADGWKDLDSVRAWVSLVADERRDSVSRIDDRYPLPDFSGREEPAAFSQDSPVGGGNTTRNVPVKKVARPRNDWLTNPWDFLGDHYWISQDGNKFQAEDSHRHKLFQTGSSKADPSRPAARRSASFSRTVKTPERTKAAKIKEEDSPKERGRLRHQRTDSLKSFHEHSSSRERKSKWPRKLIRSHSSSSSDDSDASTKLRRRGEDSRAYQNKRMLDRQLKAILDNDDKGWSWDDIKDIGDGDTTDGGSATMPSAFSSRHPSTAIPDQAALAAIGSKKHQHTSSSHTLEDYPGDKHRPSLSIERNNSNISPDQPPNKPNIPRISIDDSPTQDRSASTAGDRPRPKRSILSEMSKEREQIQDIDFASDSNNKANRKLKQSRVNLGSNIKSRFGGDLLTPEPTNNGAKLKKRRSESKDIELEKDRKDSEFKLRGLLKGARLADIVASPVNKVGDYIWRKDSPDQVDEEDLQSAPSSYNSGTDTDDEPLAPYISQEDAGLSRQTSMQEPKYHMSNLPVFKSPFKQDEGQESEGDQDHISRQQSELRQKRSARFDKLAPPSLDMRSISPSPSPPPERAREDDATSEDSRQASADVDRRFAVVEGSPDPNGRRQFVTGISEGSSRSLAQDDIGFMKLDLQPQKGKITRRDIARVSALMTSTEIKANGLLQNATSVRDPPLPILQELQSTSPTPIGSVPRAQEYVIIGGLLVKRIEEKNTALREAAEDFAHKKMSELHEQFRHLEDYVTNKLTGMVRKAADDADDLGSKLAADCTMEVKRLNDTIDLVLRKRRRRMRWVRRGGYALLEWTLLGLMWGVWLIVVVVRVFRGIARGLYKGTRWLLWLG